MPTGIQKRLSQQSRDEGNKGIVPLLHQLLTSSVEVETEEDAAWIYGLAMSQVNRTNHRKDGTGDGVFSPSSLASCLRKVYLNKNWRELGLEKISLPVIEPHFYFMTGNFLHLKWQFALYRLSQVSDDWTLIGCEVPVTSKRGDHGGTLDVVGILYGELVVIDVKGLNIRSWSAIERGDVPHDYRIQITDYGMLFNSMVTLGTMKPGESIAHHFKDGKFPKIKKGILLSENKGGPTHNNPAALCETHISIADNAADVKGRLEILREHEKRKEIPQIECTSTRTIQFTGCPFAEFCRKEVRKVERDRIADRDAKGLTLAKPKRRDRPRRSRPK